MVNIFYLPGCWSEEELGCLSVESSPPSCPDCWWPDKCSWQSPPPPHWEWSGSTSCCHWSGCSPSSCPASCCSWTRPSLGLAQHELCKTSPAAHQHLPPPSAGLGGCGADTGHEGWSEINIFCLLIETLPQFGLFTILLLEIRRTLFYFCIDA